MDMTWANAAVVSSICGVIATALTLFYKFVMAALREAHASQDETIKALLAALVGPSQAEPGLGHTAISRLMPPAPAQEKPARQPVAPTGVTISHGDQ